MEVLKIVLVITLIFGVLVGMHEFGHFLMAKLFGVWVQEFAIGFGPKIFSKKIGDTVYRLNLIPFGGYVKLYGEYDYAADLAGQNPIDEEALSQVTEKKLSKFIETNELYMVAEDALEDTIDGLAPEFSSAERKFVIVGSVSHEKRLSDIRRYVVKPIHARLFIVLGGVVVNFLLSVITFIVYLLIVGRVVFLPNITEYNFWASKQAAVDLPYLDFVGYDASKTLERSLIVEVDGTKIATPEQFANIISEKWDRDMKMSYFKDGKLLEGTFRLPGEYDTYYSPGLVKNTIVTKVLDGSPASDAGLLPMDSIISIQGEKVDSEEELKLMLSKFAGTQATFKIFRVGDGVKDIQVSLKKQETPETLVLGVNHSQIGGIPVYIIEYPNALVGGFEHSVNLLGYQTKALGKLIGDSFTKKDISIVGENVSGPIGIGNQIADLVKANNVVDLIQLFGLTSLALAFMNVLPLPVVDGGHVVLLGLEKLRGRVLSSRSQKIYNIIGLVFIIGLSVIVTLKDVFKVFLGK